MPPTSARKALTGSITLKVRLVSQAGAAGENREKGSMKLRPLMISLFSLGLLACIPVCCTASGIGAFSGPVTPVPPAASDFIGQAAFGIKMLQQWYIPGTGLYAAPAGWWNSANAVTVLANYEKVAGTASYQPVQSALANTFAAAQKVHANFINEYYDDDGWWALAWIDAYDETGNGEYLSMAETIFAAMTGAWDTTACDGGVWWSTSRKYKNAIPNELFLTIAAALANRTSGIASAGYLHWAQKEWTWFKQSGMINAQSLVNDGLTSADPHACANNGRTTWSYNQGVIVGGLVELYRANQDPTLLPQAESIADATLVHLTTPGGVLSDRSVSGRDAPQFKGVFLRNLMALYAVMPKQQYKAFAEANARSILANDQGPSAQFGALWQGPFDSADATRQTSALDALIAAAAMQ
jgi:predicted alpha-1,6-mannanase (GH76 family)